MNKGPTIDRAGSRQDYATPLDFIAAVEARFGPIVFDLAAHARNAQSGAWFGPGSAYGENALIEDWSDVFYRFYAGDDSLLWLNPPYADIKPWARKCAEWYDSNVRIAFLVPASVGSNWYWNYVAPYARVHTLHPRLSFDGKAPYPKDLILAIYGEEPGFERWLWKEKRRAA